MQDRMSELRALARQKHGAQFQVGPSGEDGDIDLEGGRGTAEARGAFMADYFQKIGCLRHSIEAVERNVARIRQLKVQAIHATSPEAEKSVSDELELILEDTNRRTTDVKNQLEKLKADNNTFAAENSSSSELRIRQNMHAAMTRRFRDVLTESQKVQTEFRQDVRAKVTRQVKVVYPEASDKDVASLVESGDMSSAALIKARIGGGHESLKGALSDIQCKYRDIRKLEQSVAELHQMFVDLATLVEAQGELLDQIEFSVSSAAEYAKKGEAELVQARKYQERARKNMCCLTVVLLIIACIILIPILVT